MTDEKRSRGLATQLLLTAGIITGCAEEPDAANMPAFDSMNEAYKAVDAAIGCEANPVGEPIAAFDGADQLPSKQKLCAENLQVDYYLAEDNLQRSFDIWAGSQQGEVHLVRGQNWLVVDLTDVATGQRTTWDIERLAEELGGEYTLAG